MRLIRYERIIEALETRGTFVDDAAVEVAAPAVGLGTPGRLATLREEDSLKILDTVALSYPTPGVVGFFGFQVRDRYHGIRS